MFTQLFLVFLSFDEILNLIESVSEDFPSYSCISEPLCLCCVEILKNLPVHSFNALIIPILRDCLPSYFLVFLSFDEILNLIESVSEDFPSYSCISEPLCLCCVEILKNHPVHSFNALFIPILKDCLPNYFLVFLSFDEILNLIESVSEDFSSYSY